MMTDAQYPAWVQDAIFYQIFPERFANGDGSNDPPNVVTWDAIPRRESFYGGDLQGVLDHLPFLEDLGVTALYLTPVFAAGTNHKYDTSDYLSIDAAFGTTDLLRSLVAACHRRGIRVVLDAVFNHCGDGFWAFKDVVVNGATSPYADWFQSASYPIQSDPPSYQTCGGAAFLPKLNLTNREVRDYLLHVTRYWIEMCDIDGWRLDVPWKAPMDFWREFRTAVKALKPDAYIVGETWRDTANWLQGDTCDGVMNYPLRECILDYCVRDTMDAEDFDHFSTRLRTVHGHADHVGLNLLGSHDTPRLLTLCAGDVRRATLSISLQFTLPGAPMVYYGDEIGLTGDNDPDCRRTMPWDAARWNQALYTTYRTLIHARRTHVALRRGEVEPLHVFNGVYAFRRAFADDEVIVVVNPRQALQGVKIAHGNRTPPNRVRRWQDLLSGHIVDAYPGPVEDAIDGHLLFELLPAQSVFVLVPVL